MNILSSIWGQPNYQIGDVRFYEIGEKGFEILEKPSSVITIRNTDVTSVKTIFE